MGFSGLSFRGLAFRGFTKRSQSLGLGVRAASMGPESWAFVSSKRGPCVQPWEFGHPKPPSLDLNPFFTKCDWGGFSNTLRPPTILSSSDGHFKALTLEDEHISSPLCRDLVISLDGGTQCGPQNALILLIGTFWGCRDPRITLFISYVQNFV